MLSQTRICVVVGEIVLLIPKPEHSMGGTGRGGSQQRGGRRGRGEAGRGEARRGAAGRDGMATGGYAQNGGGSMAPRMRSPILYFLITEDDRP